MSGMQISQLLTRNAWQNLARDKSDTLLLLTACLFVMVPHMSHLSIWISVVSSSILLWRAHITFSGQRMPSRWLLLPLAFMCMLGVYFSQRSLFGREAGVSMLVLLLVLKLLEMHAKRDLFVVTFLALFLILTNFLYSQSIATAAMMFLALLAILTAQMSFQYTGRVPPLKTRIRHSANLLLMATPLMIVLFFIFPRIQGPLWGMPNDANARSGLSETMAPGNVSNLALSEEVAFRVRFYDPPPAPAERYWRGPVLGNYDGRTWTELNWGRYPVLLLPPLDALGHSPAIRYQVTQEASGRTWLYALDIVRNLPLIDGSPAMLTREMQLRARQRINKRLRFEIASVTKYTLEAEGDVMQIKGWRELPAGFNPKSREFARQLRARESDPTRQIQTILQLFRVENFRYTLQPPLLGRDAVDDFLFNSRAGFCEHYASSFVFLARALDIPARIVTGYQGGEINPVDGIMTVRQSDAHAWTEVWLAGRGWVRIDPTAAVAPQRVEQNLASALPGNAGLLGSGLEIFISNDNPLGYLRNNFRAINTSWNQWVLDYTPERQRGLLNKLGLMNTDWATLMQLALALGGCVMAAILWPLIRLQKQQEPLDRLYSALEKLLAKQNLARQPHESPLAWGARLELANADKDAKRHVAIQQFLRLYSNQKYAKPAQQTPIKILLATLKSLLKQIR